MQGFAGWWDYVREWQPSSVRFPNGITEVLDRIRARGLVPGLWLEPEVVGVRSPMAKRLPDDAFFCRRGRRVVEAGRYHLDLRHPAAWAHLDATVDRLVEDLGVGYFKFDYNINPGPGTDVGGNGAGAGLLGHNRAQLDWLDSLLDRHPNLIIENCASGAMRSDFALLSASRFSRPATSRRCSLRADRRCRADADVAGTSRLMGLPSASMGGRKPSLHFPLACSAGFTSPDTCPNSQDQLALVREAVAMHRELRGAISSLLPRWRSACRVGTTPGPPSRSRVPKSHCSASTTGAAAQPSPRFPCPGLLTYRPGWSRCSRASPAAGPWSGIRQRPRSMSARRTIW